MKKIKLSSSNIRLFRISSWKKN